LLQKKKESGMFFALVVLVSTIEATMGHSLGLSSCSQPMHRSLSSADRGSVGATIDGSSIIISATSKFRGFLFVAGDGLRFTTAPEHSEISDICYRTPGRAIAHTSPFERDNLVIGFSCVAGTTVSMTGYVVFKYSTPFVSVGGSFTCPEEDSFTTTVEPASSETTTTTASTSS
jgi:hypothetical protein